MNYTYTRKYLSDKARAAEAHCADLARLVEDESFPDVHIQTAGPLVTALATNAWNLMKRVAAARW